MYVCIWVNRVLPSNLDWLRLLGNPVECSESDSLVTPNSLLSTVNMSTASQPLLQYDSNLGMHVLMYIRI